MGKRKNTPAEESSSLDYARQWMQKLRDLVPDAIQNPTEETVHDARVATRRLKAALEIAGPAIGHHDQKTLGKVLRKLRQRLGPMRDADVMLTHLADVGKVRLKPGADWLADRVNADAAAAKKKAKKKLDPSDTLSTLGTWWGVEQAWSAAIAEVDAGITKALHEQLDEFARRADAVFGPKPETEPETDDRDPHALRIAGKSLRYTVEIAAAAGHPLPGKIGKAFKRMQDALGLWHDYVVLAEYALHESVDADLVLHDPGLQAVVLDLARNVIGRAARQLDQFHRQWITGGPDLIATLRQAVPVKQAETGPGPQHSPPPEPDPGLFPAAS
jgi:CHAD domain-containing protein